MVDSNLEGCRRLESHRNGGSLQGGTIGSSYPTLRWRPNDRLTWTGSSISLLAQLPLVQLMTVKEDMSIQVNKQAQTHQLSRHSDWATVWLSKKSWFDSRAGKCYISSPQLPKVFWGPPK